MDHDYHMLGLSPGASDAEIRQAYRDLVKVWHPDRFSTDARLQLKADEKLKQVNQAYERLISGRATGAAGRNSAQAPDPVPGPESRDRDQHAEPESQPPPRARRPRRRAAALRFGEMPLMSAAMVAIFIGLLASVLPGNPLRNSSVGRTFSSAARWVRTIGRTPTDQGHVAAAHEGAREPAEPPDAGEEPTPPAAARSSVRQPRDVPAIALPAPAPVVIEVAPDAFAATVSTSGNEKESFTLGDGKRRVRRVQGAPTVEDDKVWQYGRSSVSFSDGKVAGYSNDGILRIRLRPRDGTPRLMTFSLKATADEVLTTQGTPTAVVGNTWFYGGSSVTFSSGIVGGYTNVGGNLRVK